MCSFHMFCGHNYARLPVDRTLNSPGPLVSEAASPSLNLYHSQPSILIKQRIRFLLLFAPAATSVYSCTGSNGEGQMYAVPMSEVRKMLNVIEQSWTKRWNLGGKAQNNVEK